MTVEQLMQPRYKVIADYPSNTEHTIGETLYADKDGIFWCYSETGRWRIHPEQYPHIFRKLEWWEERDEKDMPGYVKDEYGVYKVMNNWYDLDSDGCCSAHTFRDNKFYAKHVLPATEQEYNDYINQFK